MVGHEYQSLIAAFRSSATNLVAGGTTNQQVFERDVKLGTTTLVSQSSTSVQGNGNSSRPSISGDGNSIAFSSDATNLVPGDSNANQDVFLRNQNAGTTVRVSVSSAGAQGNSGTYNSSISTGGRYIAMTTSASNLVPGDLNASSDIILRDRKTDKTKLVSLSNSGAQGNSGSFLVDPAITPNGQYITFTSVATNLVGGGTSNEQVFVRDMVNLKTKLISQSTAGVEGNSSSFDSSISADGRFVAFSSNATNLVGNDTLGYRDIFVRGPVH
jgi:Tol biopolymer transport system component